MFLVSKKYLEKFWDCPACGKKHVSALRNTRCPSCGSSKVPQDEELFSYEEIHDNDGLDLAAGGPHWTCSNCGTKNLDKNTHCDGCGNQRDSEDSTNQIRTFDHLPVKPLVQEDEKVDQSQIVTNIPGSNREPSTPHVLDIHDRQTVSYDVHTNPKKLRFGTNINWRIVAVILAVVVVLGGLGFLTFHTTSYSSQVTGFSWQRNINIEEYQVFHESNWDSSPSGAYNVTSSYLFYEKQPIYETKTRQVYVPSSYTTYTDLGNGAVVSNTVDTSHYETEYYQELTGYRDIYKWYYTYDINRWSYTRSVVTKEEDHNPYWGDYSLRYNGLTTIGAERVGSTSEMYLVFFQVKLDKETKTFSLSTNQNDWNEYVIGNSYTLKVNHFGAITNDPLREGK